MPTFRLPPSARDCHVHVYGPAHRFPYAPDRPYTPHDAPVERPQRILSRDQLLDLSRLHNAEVYDRSIDVQILRLRRKIEADPAHPRFIKTERGAGYVFDAVVEAVR